MRVCVTGGTGYMGAQLVRALAARCEVHVVARRPEAVPPCAASHRWPADVSALLASLRPDVLVHLVAHYVRRAAAADLPVLQAVQVDLGLRVLQGALDAGVGRVVVASSAHAVGHLGGPVSAYGEARQRFEVEAVRVCASASVPLARLVVHDVYGPDDPRPKLVPALLAAARTGVAAPLVRDGEMLDLVHVHDVVRGFEHAVLGPAFGGAAALRSGEVCTAVQVHALLERVLGRPVPTVSHPGTPLERPLALPWAGPDLPGWAPTVRWAEGVRRLALSESR